MYFVPRLLTAPSFSALSTGHCVQAQGSRFLFDNTALRTLEGILSGNCYAGCDVLVSVIVRSEMVGSRFRSGPEKRHLQTPSDGSHDVFFFYVGLGFGRPEFRPR